MYLHIQVCNRSDDSIQGKIRVVKESPLLFGDTMEETEEGIYTNE